MRELIKNLDAEYGFNLSESEIDLVVRQAQKAAELLRSLHTLDLREIAPLMKIDRQETHERK